MHAVFEVVLLLTTDRRCRSRAESKNTLLGHDLLDISQSLYIVNVIMLNSVTDHTSKFTMFS